DLSQGLVKPDEVDRLLAECARRLAACVSDGYMLARIDGERFALGGEIKSRDLAEGIKFCEALANRLIAALAPAPGKEVSFPCSLNIGIN
ncbi:diguanylate cyclase, partial [Salmonella enterica]